jgi:hypothetical protein
MKELEGIVKVGHLEVQAPVERHAAGSALNTLKLLGVTGKKLFARATRHLGFVYPWSRIKKIGM